MNKKWLIAVDLDGTLLHTDHQISTRTLDVMHRVVELGHQMVVVTGRSSFSSVARLQSIPQSIRLVCSNGAYEFDRHKHSILWSTTISTPEILALQQSILQLLPDASFGWENAVGLTYESAFISEAGGADTLEQGGLETKLDQYELFKLFVRTPQLKGGELVVVLQELIGNRLEVSSSGVPFAEITAAGMNKGSALEKVATELAFTQDRTMAFGDNLNDVPMLAWAGESVAMANGIDEIKNLATAQSLGNAEDGVACYLERRLLNTSR